MTITTKAEAEAAAQEFLKESRAIRAKAEALADRFGFSMDDNGLEYVPTHVDGSTWSESDAESGATDFYWTSSNEGNWVSSSDKCY